MKGKPSSVQTFSQASASAAKTSGKEVNFMVDLKTQTSQLLPLVAPRWHREFLRFLATGESSREFFSYLDSDAKCQCAVTKAINARAKLFRKLAETLRAPK